MSFVLAIFADCSHQANEPDDKDVGTVEEGEIVDDDEDEVGDDTDRRFKLPLSLLGRDEEIPFRFAIETGDGSWDGAEVDDDNAEVDVSSVDNAEVEVKHKPATAVSKHFTSAYCRRGSESHAHTGVRCNIRQNKRWLSDGNFCQCSNVWISCGSKIC